MSTPSTWIKLKHKGFLRRGYAYGLHQSSLEWICELQSVLPPNWQERLHPLSMCVDSRPDPTATLIDHMAHWVGGLQRQARIPVSYRFTVMDVTPPLPVGPSVRQIRMVLPVIQPEATRLSLLWLMETINRLLSASVIDAVSGHAQVLKQISGFAEPGVNAYSIRLAADAMGLPLTTSMPNHVWVLGQGVKARWFNSTLTDAASALSVFMAQHKMDTALLLRRFGLPGATHRRVSSPEEAIQAAHALAYPVVVKPANLSQGQGVAADLRTDAQVYQAYQAARALSNEILVERWQEGYTHRLTVVHGQLFRVTQRLAGGVTGDGLHTVAELVALQQLTPEQQGRSQRKGRVLLDLDEEALGLLHQSGRSPQEVLAKGEYVRLRRRDNINAGGRNIHLGLDQVHPDNVRLAQDAANALRLDIAGVDFITTDINRSWREVGGLICEVNAKPQLGANSHGHAYPELLRRLLPHGGHIPLDVVMCPEDLASHQSTIDRLGPLTDGLGVSSIHGLWMAGAWRSLPFEHGYAAAVSLLLRTDVQSAVCLMTPAELLQWGAPSNRLASLRLAGTDRWCQAQRDAVRQVEAMLQAYVATGEGMP